MKVPTQRHPESSRECGELVGRLIATIGGARIVRQRDGSLHVHGETPRDRDAALAWLFTVSPGLATRVRRCDSLAA